jgi:DsbC/DsbD-like thiol-disulfide interchange protein
VEVLAGFAERYGIRYPLLSDEGSRFIRELGILNEQANENVFGIPHPGMFVLNADGSIRSKHFYPSYRERDTGPGTLEHLLGIASGAKTKEATAASGGVFVRAWLDRDAYSWGQRIWLGVELQMEPGVHVYGSPIPDGYFPLELSVEPIERVHVGEPQWPPATPFKLEGLDDEFFVHTGSVRVGLPLTFMVVDAGRLEVRLTVSYQACTESECFAPARALLTLPIDERPLIERPSR